MKLYLTSKEQLFSVILSWVFFQTAHGFQIFTNETVPKNLTGTCSTALLKDISCSPVVLSLRSGDYYPVSTLNKTCTTACQTALSQYESTVVSSCNGQSWNGYEDTPMPLSIIPDLLRYQFNLTCLMDSGRYCNNIAAQAAFSLDPGGEIKVSLYPILPILKFFSANIFTTIYTIAQSKTNTILII